MNMDSSLCVIWQKYEDTDGLRKCSSRISKLMEYRALFGLTLLASYLDRKHNEESHIKIHATCPKNI